MKKNVYLTDNELNILCYLLMVEKQHYKGSHNGKVNLDYEELFNKLSSIIVYER